MQRWHDEDVRPLVVLAAVLVAAALFLVLRPSEEEAAPARTGRARTTPPRTTAPRLEAPATTARARTTPAPRRVTARVTVRGGRVEGGIRRISVSRGSLVTLVVTADVSDHVHLHGYDVMRDVAPGAPARLSFRATIPGRFEIELEDAGRQIAEVEVRP